MDKTASSELEPDALAGAPHPREQRALIGHEAAERAFLEAVRTGRLHHAWLVGGPFGIGKATFAYRAARLLLTPGPMPADFDAAGEGPAARRIAAQAHPDLVVVRRGLRDTGKGHSAEIRVADVRRALDLFNSTAGEGGYRVCIVDAADDLNASSGNALLKVIEEPPPRSVFLIVAHAPQRVLPTIRSRCRRLMLKPLGPDAVHAAVRSLGPPWSDAPEPVLARAVELGEGSVRRTLEMLDETKIGLVDEVERLLALLPRLDVKRLSELSEMLIRKDGEAALALMLDTVQRWASRRIAAGASAGAARLAPLVEVCEKAERQAREADEYNLDRRPLLITLFGDLAEAVA